MPKTLTPEEFKRLYPDLAVPDIGETIDLPVRPDIPLQQSIGGAVGSENISTGLQEILSATPSIIGGMAGGAMGGPVGAAAGGVGGATLSEMLRSKFPGVFGKPSETGERVWNVASEAVVPAGMETANRVLQFGKRYMPDPATMARINTLEAADVPYLAGDVRPGGIAQTLETLFRGGLFSGRHMAEHDARLAKSLVEFKENLFDNLFGKGTDKVKLGQVLQTAAGVQSENTEQVLGFMYDQLDDALKYAPVPIQKLQRQAGSLVNDIEKQYALNPEFLKRFQGTPFYQWLKSVETLPSTARYTDLKKLKTNLSEIEKGAINTEFGGTIGSWKKRAYGMIDEGKIDAADAMDPRYGKILKKLDEQYTQYHDLFERRDMAANARLMSPDRFVDTYLGTGSDFQRVSDLLDAIPKPYQKKIHPLVQRRVVEDMINKSSRIVMDADRRVPHGQLFLQQLTDEKNKSTIERLFAGSPDKLKAIREFAEAAAQSQASKRVINPASGRQMFTMTQAAELGEGGVALAGGELGKTASALAKVWILPSTFARILTNPTMARFFARGFKLPVKSREAWGWRVRALEILRILEGGPEGEVQDTSGITAKTQEYP